MISNSSFLGELPDFSLKINGPVSSKIVARNIHRFHGAINFVNNIAYGRNSSKLNLTTVIDESKGTCSTKHALIKTLLDEHEVNSIHLMMGIYRMNEENTPGIGPILSQHGLEYLPEAHNYLKYRDKRYDYTFPGPKNPIIFEQLLEEIIIVPQQIAKFKVDYHQEFLSNWLTTEQLNTTFSLDTIWGIREACIQRLSNKN